MFLRFEHAKLYRSPKEQQQKKKTTTNGRICAFSFFKKSKRIVLGKDPSEVSVLIAPLKQQQHEIDPQDNPERTDKIKHDGRGLKV